MILAFELSIPRNNAWNGKWSGEGRRYVITRNVRSKETADKIVSEGPYYYDFGDGWCAKISVSVVDAVEARKLRKASVGFAGYDWMIERIFIYGKIIADHQLTKETVTT